MAELKPRLRECPYCGCKAQIRKSRDSEWIGVRCSNFGCIANSINPEYANPLMAIEAWNRRVNNE